MKHVRAHTFLPIVIVMIMAGSPVSAVECGIDVIQALTSNEMFSQPRGGTVFFYKPSRDGQGFGISYSLLEYRGQGEDSITNDAVPPVDAVMEQVRWSASYSSLLLYFQRPIESGWAYNHRSFFTTGGLRLDSVKIKRKGETTGLHDLRQSGMRYGFSLAIGYELTPPSMLPLKAVIMARGNYILPGTLNTYPTSTYFDDDWTMLEVLLRVSFQFDRWHF